ncbi:DUF309 domain-containing protein [Stygiobacter electus]|uniref:DUF309 domain-containing protein n=1 Tax=Stygiobacter electus TaxID=3032292 RepID=A0AAE3TEX9_9BACT|nr:DUF309 domain-containing protein [Stygiobacter electus]MDF1612768.1 DUF309 domain-containing protein [Stygiobacter electus]
MKYILQGIELFNNCDFFEAHDFFENLWFESDKADKKFYQSLVHISVGSFHLISGNYSGCLNQLEKFYVKIQNYLPEYKNLNTEKLNNEISLLINKLKENKVTFEPSDFWNLIPKIEVINKNSQI